MICVTGYSICTTRPVYGLSVGTLGRDAVRECCVNTSYRAITSCVGVYDSIYVLVALTSLSKYWTSSSSMAGDVMASRRRQRDSKMADSCVIAATE